MDLCLPHDLHADMMIRAAQAGKHILCEKPLAMTIADCDRMIAAAREHNVVLMHGENLRLVAHVERAAQMVREGAYRAKWSAFRVRSRTGSAPT